MAVFYLRQPVANVSGARRKAIQALAALRGLSDLLTEAVEALARLERNAQEGGAA